jgi:hypothetical protein
MEVGALAPIRNAQGDNRSHGEAARGPIDLAKNKTMWRFDL